MKEIVSNLTKTARVKSQHNAYCRFKGEGMVRKRKERQAWQEKRWEGRKHYIFPTTGAFWLTDAKWGYAYNIKPPMEA